MTGAAMTSSPDLPELRPASPADRAALRASAEGARGLTHEEYFKLLAQFPASPEELRRRRCPGGAPFRL